MFFHLAFRIRKLGIGMFNHRHDRRLFRFLPIYTIVTQVIGSNREGDFLAKAVHESTGFTDIGKIIRQERILSELVGRNISVLRGNLATELAGTVPDAFQFRIIKRRIALGCFVQKFLTGFIRHTETLDQSARNTGQGAVALPFWNAAVRFHQCQPVLDSQTPFVPNHLTFRAKQKTGGIQRIAGVTEKLVPFMALFYVVLAVGVVVLNVQRLPYVLESIVAGEQIELDVHQEEAVIEAVNNGLLIITGGPGTGKTTTINMIIRCFEKQGMSIMLAAPTGRAAKRMTEATGCEAQTIHRMLEYNGAPGEQEENVDRGAEQFGRNEWNPLETDVIIIDEMSMVDIYLFHSLLKAVAVGTRLILVGDVNQLPSVGPGNVLKDIIQSHCFNVVKLSRIFRQAAESDIIVNAHKINAGEPISLDNQSKDFFCLKRDDSHGVLEVMLWLVRDRMPKYTHCTPFDVQVLTPMKKGELGVHRCNEVLQRHLNPEAPGKPQIESHGVLFRQGDKVMQMKNNYQIKWEIRGYNGYCVEEGSGVFNGDCGIIQEIDAYNKQVTVLFDEEKYVTYSQGELDELELAYAITVHKSQGSEYPAVVIPLLSGLLG